jgi:hypothetical protein
MKTRDGWGGTVYQVPFFLALMFVASSLCGQVPHAAKARHPAVPSQVDRSNLASPSKASPHCVAWFSPGMGEVFWRLEVLGDTVEYAKLSEAWPGQDGDLVTAVWRHRHVTGQGSRLCRDMATAPWEQAEPPILDGAVHVFRFAGQGGMQEKVLGHTPGNGEKFSALLAAVDSLSHSVRRPEALVFGLHWSWQGQKPSDQVVPAGLATTSSGAQAVLRVRHEGMVRASAVTAKLRFGREVWERQFPGPPPLDTLSDLDPSCLTGEGTGKVSGKGAAKSRGDAWDRCPVNLPRGWKAAQVVLRGTLPLLSGPQTFQAASAFLVKE